MFVLIVGARYGTQTERGKSITNLEYLEAKAKGIPIYVFVSKPILHALPLWKKNRDGDYTGIVDSTKLFEFVESLHDSKVDWVFGFETAADITDRIKRQFALLFMDGLLALAKFRKSQLSPAMQDLAGEPLRILFDRPFVWELQLFASVLNEEITRRAQLKLDHKYGLKLGKVRELQELEVMEWIGVHVNAMQHLTNSAVTLMKQVANEAIGPSGTPGNPELIVYTARRLGDIYGRLLEWSLECRQTTAPDHFDGVLEALASFPVDFITKIESLVPTVSSELEKAEKALAKGEDATVDLMLTLDAPDMTSFYAECERVCVHYGVPFNDPRG